MRILIISQASSWMRGGVPAETSALVQGLAERGHVLALACDAPLRGAEAARHVPLSPVGHAEFGRQIEAALAQFRPDFVHVMCMSSRGVLQLEPIIRAHPWALTAHSIPPYENKLLGSHASDEWHYLLRNLRYLPNSLLWRYVFLRGHVPRVIVHSAFVQRIAISYGYPAKLVDRIPLFVRFREPPADAGSALRNPGAPLLLTVGGLTHTKGQRDVVAALPKLLDQFPALSYRMVGEVRDESYVRSLRRMADRLGVGGSISIASDLDNEALEHLRATADVYIQPSHEEGFCLAYAEAASRIPRLVGTASGAIAEMSEGDPGASVVPIRNSGAISEAISIQLGKSLPDGHMLGRMRRLAKRFSFADYIAAHEALYSGAARNRPK